MATLVSVSAADDLVRFDFETGDLQGWMVVEGKFDRLVSDREVFHNVYGEIPGNRYNKQGKHYLSSVERQAGPSSDRMTGVIESPVFVLSGPDMSMLVGSGTQAKTYVALCTLDGKEVLVARGKAQTEIMQRVAWHAPELQGKQVFLRIVDQETGGWGHVTFDDFTARARMDQEASRQRFAGVAEHKARQRFEEFMTPFSLGALRAAINDLISTFGDRYPRGREFLARLDAIERQVRQVDGQLLLAGQLGDVPRELENLRREAMIANPLVSGQPILYVVRHQYRSHYHAIDTLFHTGELNADRGMSPHANLFQGGAALKAIDFSRFKPQATQPGSTSAPHEPPSLPMPPHPVPLPLGGGEGAQRAGEGVVQGLKTPDFGSEDYPLGSLPGPEGILVRTLFETRDGVVRDPEVHFDGKKIVFALRRHAGEDYHIWEINADGAGLRQLTSAEGVSDFDPMYLPDERIVFSSTRDPKYNMCSRDHGANLFRMEGDGANIHQIGKNTLFDNQPSLMPDGRILYARWEYVDRNFGDAHALWTVNPDGSSQSLYWKNNTVSPAAALAARIIPRTERAVCILGPHHDHLWGAMAVIDRRLGLEGRDGVVRIWPSQAMNLIRAGGPFDCDSFSAVQPKYADPYPLGEKYFLCSRSTPGGPMGLCLLDMFGNEILLHVEGPGCYDPMPLQPQPRPPVLPARREFATKMGFFLVADVYQGTPMQGVKRGSVKALRVVESPEKRHWSRGSWSGQGYTAPGMNWHSLENKRILGTVPVEADGSAHFSVPAETFVYFQLLDENGMMIQSMRSGANVHAGEVGSCVG